MTTTFAESKNTRGAAGAHGTSRVLPLPWQHLPFSPKIPFNHSNVLCNPTSHNDSLNILHNTTFSARRCAVDSIQPDARISADFFLVSLFRVDIFSETNILREEKNLFHGAENVKKLGGE